MKLSAEALKELGKFFYNLALALLIGLVIQPLANEKVIVAYLVTGLLSAILSLIFGFTLITIGSKLDGDGNRRR